MADGLHPLFNTTLPRGWRLLKVDDLKSPEKSSCAAGPFGSNIGSKFFVEAGVPVIRGNNLRDNLTRFVPQGFVFVSPEQAMNYKGQHVRAGDLVFTCWGTIGQVGLIPEDGPFSEYIISNKQLKLRPNREIADSLFLFYYFASPEMVAHIRNRAIGAAVPGISLAILKELSVVLPPLETQRAIAFVLSAYDDLIENNTRRIQILERMAQAIYREWFANFRFPGHGKVKLVESPLGKIPQGWQVRRLDEVASLNGLSIRRGEGPREVLYVDISSVATGRIEKIEPMRFADAPGRARRIVRHGDTVWSCVRPNRKSFSLILNPPANLIVSTGFAVLTPANVPFAFLYQAVTTDDFVAYLTNHATGAAYPAVTARDFEAAKMVVPDDSLLRLFHEQCEPMMLLKENLLRKNGNLRHTRDLLLPKLISGALSVENMEFAE